MEKYCVVVRHRGKEVGRSKPMGFEEAIAKVRSICRASQDHTWNCERNLPYVETAASVKHLPVVSV